MVNLMTKNDEHPRSRASSSYQQLCELATRGKETSTFVVWSRIISTMLTTTTTPPPPPLRKRKRHSQPTVSHETRTQGLSDWREKRDYENLSTKGEKRFLRRNIQSPLNMFKTFHRKVSHRSLARYTLEHIQQPFRRIHLTFTLSLSQEWSGTVFWHVRKHHHANSPSASPHRIKAQRSNWHENSNND